MLKRKPKEPLDPREDPTSLGHILKPFGVTPDDVARAMDYIGSFQNGASPPKIGEALVHLEVITEEELEIALARQRLTRNNDGKKRKGTHEDISKILDFATKSVKDAPIGNITGKFSTKGVK